MHGVNMNCSISGRQGRSRDNQKWDIMKSEVGYTKSEMGCREIKSDILEKQENYEN